MEAVPPGLIVRRVARHAVTAQTAHVELAVGAHLVAAGGHLGRQGGHAPMHGAEPLAPRRAVQAHAPRV
eukprot:scaffold120157_cov63-Phaeocystis_antarctica.AAC.2